MMRRRYRKRRKDVLAFTTAGVTMGVGSHAIGKVGGTTAASSKAGLSRFAGFMPTMGTVKGASWVMEELGEMQRTKRKRRRRR